MAEICKALKLLQVRYPGSLADYYASELSSKQLQLLNTYVLEETVSDCEYMRPTLAYHLLK